MCLVTVNGSHLKMTIDYGEMEAYIRGELRIQLDDDDIGRAQLIDLYNYIIMGLDVDEELERTFVMYQWASIISAKFKAAAREAEIERRAWQGQTGVDLRGQGIKFTTDDVKNAIRSEPEWARLGREEVKYEKFASIFTSFAIILYKKADTLSNQVGARRKADYGDFNVRRQNPRERDDKVRKKHKKKLKRKPV